MSSRRNLFTVALASAFFLAACGGDDPEAVPGAAAPPDQAAPGAAQGIDPDLMQLMTEAQELQTRIAPVRDQALDDPELASQLTELQERIEAALRETSGELMDQMDGLEAEFESAQAAGDEERMQEIAMQAQMVQMQIQSAQEEILDRQEIRDDIDAFEARHREAMLEIEPQLEEALDRLEEIMEQLQAAAP